MNRFLITGATGTIGKQIIKAHFEIGSNLKVVAAVRDKNRAIESYPDLSNVDIRHFDFGKENSYSNVLQDMDLLFLLRPPHLTSVEKIFRPLLETAGRQGVKKIIFLSVMGVEKNKMIPHYKIEKLILELGFEFIFVRPSYFMQNLTGALLKEIQDDRMISLPSGDAKLNWIDAVNIGQAILRLAEKFDWYKNQSFVLTGTENMSFGKVAELISEYMPDTIVYRSVNPISFFLKKRREGMKKDFAVVMTLIHFLPRFQQEPELTDDFQKIVGTKPTDLRTFIEREKKSFRRIE